MGCAKIMVQGTTSSAGKSFLVTGLMRIFAEEGLRAYPYKAQNMSRNAAELPDGRKMAAAQVLQARAGGRAPEVSMNPVLLIPEDDCGSRVVLWGKDTGLMRAREYFAFKPSLRGRLLEDFRRLESENDIIVIEGAGSPAEINLRENDIVNMGLAEMVDAPVILVADIDRGGVFASLYGTVMLLDPEERRRIRGLVINRFRGDASLLKSGVEMVENLTGIPVIGLIPYLEHALPEEDSIVDAPRHALKPEEVDNPRALEPIFSSIAAHLWKHLDMTRIREIAGLSQRIPESGA